MMMMTTTTIRSSHRLSSHPPHCCSPRVAGPNSTCSGLNHLSQGRSPGSPEGWLPAVAMPRKARMDAPGALHHIIIRGIELKAIFKDNSDRENFLDRLSAIVSESQTGCYGWTMLTNHVHLLLKTGLSPVTTVMRRLLTGHAVSFIRRHRRHGQLFQNRYRSFLCEIERMSLLSFHFPCLMNTDYY